MYLYVGIAVALTALGYFVQHRRRKRDEFKKTTKSEFADRGTRWSKDQHEFYVERFYETGLTGTHDFHGGMLNFGFWTNGNKDYIKAGHELLSQVADPVKLNGESTLLDVANGMGAQDVFFMKKYSPAHIDMIDLTLSHHLIAKKRMQDNNLQDRVTAHYGSAVDLPFEDNKFSHVFSVEGGAHFPTREKFFGEALRVLKPGGWMSLADYAMPKRPTGMFENMFARLCAKLWNAPLENWYGCEDFKTRMEAAGFVDVVVKDVGEYTIPGYYEESVRPEILAQLSKIRGWFTTYVACRVLDELILYVYKKNILTYVIAYGRKP
ncbi:erythromycin 3''-O-methyltransferase-like [Sycon ciliatum]|uniref:erythromycin 3''-O-methyltransferase-like n=1 Tax=Sycon ciliatum TaxID=27933 RepID=UPI0020AAA372|eukprot:scpid54831/ scgid23290/ Tocopherol O-methyltransferase, chloroplastic; Gamma-tocopherol methyltransferase; Vitamin E pathway gene 4 protein